MNLAGTGQQAVHKPGVKKIPVYHAVLDQFPLYRLVQKIFQDFFQVKIVCLHRKILIAVLMEQVQKQIGGVDPLGFRSKSGLDPVFN